MSKINVSELSHASNGGDPNIELYADGSTSIRNLQNQYAKNLIINGGMSVAQRATSVADISTAGYHTIDRMRHSANNLGTARFTISQATDGPAGFPYCYKLETTTAEAAGAQTGLRIQYLFEGNDLKNLSWGTADAKPLTVSFWVKTSVQGAYSLTLYREESTARNIGTAFTISPAEVNKWKFITHTFPGDQVTPATLDVDTRMLLKISMAEGSDFITTDNTSWGNYSSDRYAFGQTAQLHETVNSTFSITGLQVTPTDELLEFQHESLGETLSKCQRYYQLVDFSTNNGGITGNINASWYLYQITLPTTMRAAPSLAADYAYGNNTSRASYRLVNDTYGEGFKLQNSQPTGATIRGNSSSTTIGVAGRCCFESEL